MFSAQLLDHFENPRNVGRLDSPAVLARACNPVCGDELALSVRFEREQVAAVRYQVRGCTASIAVGSALTELIAGKTQTDLAALTAADIERAVGGLPNESKHAAALAADALNALLAAANSPT
jgi:nitrogen fixation NifU-like protein